MAASTINDAVFRYGAFLTALIPFVTTAAALFFFVVKPVNTVTARVRKPAEEEEVTDEECNGQLDEVAAQDEVAKFPDHVTLPVS